MKDAEFVSRDIAILVVDDHASTRDLIKAILRSAGFTRVLQADNGRNALEMLRRERFGLIICDWNMPVLNGLETLKSVRGDAALSNLPFIMLTAESYSDSLKAAIAAGVSDYIAKPFTADTLLNKIASVFARA
jgi:two-component system chemotaxis response regulator CheY